MSTSDFDPTRRSQASTNEQVPHSGVHHDEQPVTEFDNTPLRDAPISHELPQDVTTGHLPEDMRPGHSERRSKKGILLGAGTIASLIAAGTLWIGFGNDNSSDKKGPAPTQPVATAPADSGAEQATTSPEKTEQAMTHVSLLTVNGAELQHDGSALTPHQLEVSLQPIMKTAEENVTATEAMNSMMGEINAFYNGGVCDREHYAFGVNEESDATKAQRDQQNQVLYGDAVPESLTEAVHVQNETRATIAELRFPVWNDGEKPFTVQISGDVLSENQISDNVYHVTVHYQAASNVTEISPVAADQFASDDTKVFELTLQPNGQWIITGIQTLPN